MTAASRRYAKAAFSLGVETGEFERIGREIQLVVSAMETDPSLRDILINPLYDPAAKRGIIAGLADKKGLSPVTRNFLLLLLDKRRLSLLPEILTCYQTLSDEKAGRVRATVVTAAKVSDGTLEELTASLEKRTGKKVTLVPEVDPDLIGGIVVKVGDIIYDGSLRTQLRSLRDSIRKTI